LSRWASGADAPRSRLQAARQPEPRSDPARRFERPRTKAPGSAGGYLQNARRRACRIWALDTDFDLKDRLKERGYRWSNGEDGRPRAWFRDVDEADLAEEEQFLAEKIYGGQPRHDRSRIDFRNRFSDRE